MWRYGDVMIAAIDAIPEGARLRPDVVVARGESTGHSHRIELPRTAELWKQQFFPTPSKHAHCACLSDTDMNDAFYASPKSTRSRSAC